MNYIFVSECLATGYSLIVDTNFSFSYQSKLKCGLEEISSGKIRLYLT